MIIGRRGEMGRCAVVTEREAGWLCGTGSMAIRPNPDVLPEYLQRFLSSPSVVQMLESASVGSTMANLNQSILFNLDFYLPSLAEQREIVRRIDSALAHIGRAEAEPRRRRW
jgi:type I restriction enzyme S subunit